MKFKTITTLSFCLLFLSLSINASAQQSKSLSEKSYQQARQAVEAGIKAMGGLEALQSVADVTREMAGTRTDEGQGMQPVPRTEGATPPATNHPKLKSVRDLRGQRISEEVEDTIFGGQPIKSRSVLAGNTFFFASDVTRNIRVPPPSALPAIRAARFRRFPESLLLTAWTRPETLRWLGEGEYEGRKVRAVSFADADGSETALYFDTQTGLLTKTETLADDPVLGDVSVEVIYGDWRPVNRLLLPFRYTDRLGGVTVQDMRASSILLDTHPPDSLFAMPEGYAKIDPVPPVPVVKKLADDVYAITGPYNSLFVVFKDYVLVVEAGANNRYSQASIAEIKKVVPDKPIRYLVSTHFHFDHLGGVRSYIAEGTTIVTTPGAKSIVERLAAAPHQLRPDALSRKSVSPVIETFKDKRVFEDGTHTVELYQIAGPHAGEMIIAYLPKEKILFEADMLDIPEAGLVPAGDDTVDLADKVQKLGLQVESIIPVHGRMGTIDELRQAVARRISGKAGEQAR
jgi:glyoxylase-like metal-dependent hydrolase (beta-lactamase superfamily II)